MGRISSGDLNQRVTFQLPGAPTTDARGGQVASGAFTESARWAKVEPLSGGELMALGQILSTNAYRVTVRREPNTSQAPNQRIAWNGRTLNVQRVVADTRNEYVIFTCFTSGKQ